MRILVILMLAFALLLPSLVEKSLSQRQRPVRAWRLSISFPWTGMAMISDL